MILNIDLGATFKNNGTMGHSESHQAQPPFKTAMPEATQELAQLSSLAQHEALLCPLPCASEIDLADPHHGVFAFDDPIVHSTLVLPWYDRSCMRARRPRP